MNEKSNDNKNSSVKDLASAKGIESNESSQDEDSNEDSDTKNDSDDSEVPNVCITVIYTAIVWSVLSRKTGFSQNMKLICLLFCTAFLNGLL